MGKRIVIVNERGEVQKKYLPMPSEARHFSEDLLQKMIFEEPNLLPSEDIDPDFSNLIPISREFPVKSGSIDVLFITPEGKICVVETKLWRNPEAHRSVVAQIIDYATDLSKMSFEVFCENATKAKGAESIKAFFKKIKEKYPGLNEEIKLTQNIQDSLSHGRFLLMIVGDEIFHKVALLTESIASAPHLEFNIAFAELKFYRTDEDQDTHLLVVPQIVGQSKPDVRAVVRIIYEQKKPDVVVTPIEPPEDTKLNEDTFMKSLDPEGQIVFKEILKLNETHGFPIHWGTTGFSLNVDLRGKHVALCYGYGKRAYWGQSVSTYFTDIIKKVENGERIAQTFREKLRRTNIFDETKKDLSFKFKKKLSETQIADLIKILVELANSIQTNGAKVNRVD
jgi:hypothetical protein